ncbi:MAG: carboxymuconolactone decarboxylase family protein [Betaproteobacteria bacterium]|nr:carboxymuconolactone decarboxylase family protein [Betaproteobacteria bacterium]
MLGQALGLTDEEFEALQGDYRASPLFNDREKAVLAWSEAMTLNTAKRDEVVWTELRRLFSDAEIVEVSLACAMFNMINRLNDSFRTELEPEEYNRRQHGAVGVTARALEDYACRICSSSEGGET